MLGVKEIYQADDRTLGITWSDGVEQSFDVVALRENCPCALCVDELTGEKIPQKIDPMVRPKKISNVGLYALRIEFTDGHKTGIYTFEKLKSGEFGKGSRQKRGQSAGDAEPASFA